MMGSSMPLLRCPSCGSEYFKKNGLTHNGKQSYRCRCGRQFVDGGTSWFVDERDKELINKLLLERFLSMGSVVW